MKYSKNKNLKRNGIRLLKVVLAAVLIGLLAEIAISGIQYARGDQRGLIQISEEEIAQMSVNGAARSIRISLDQEYVNKLVYFYSSESDYTCTITVHRINPLGIEDTVEIQDDSMAILGRSVVNIGETVTAVELQFDSASQVQISEIQVDNTFQMSPFRMVFLMASVYLLLFLICFRKEYQQHVEWAFLNISLVMGILFIAINPPHCNSWDEHIHFMHCYEIAAYGDETVPASVDYLYSHPQDYRNRAASAEERIDEIRTLNQLHMNDSARELRYQNTWRIKTVGYIFQALFLKIGMILHFPFWILWMFGKLANVLLYSIVVFFAVRKTPVGKMLLTCVALMPTALFLTSAYTYDVTVNAFLMYAAAVFVKALYDKPGNFTLREQFLFVGAVVVGSCPKFVYLPLVLLALLLPADRFPSRKNVKIYRGIFLAGAVLGAALFAVLVLGNLSASGDLRGGDTSPATQLSLIIRHPVAYARLLLESIFGTGIDYGFIFENGDRGGYTDYGYSGALMLPLFIFAELLFVAMTDTAEPVTSGKTSRSRYVMRWTERAGILAVVLIVLCMIWSALYLSFTEVGSMEIAGVQARYYFPIIWILALGLRSEKIQIYWNRVRYQCVILCLSTGYLLWNLYELMVKAMCL